MLAKCANPFCGASFHYFREGKLFRLEVGTGQTGCGSSARSSRWFWLCGQCAANVTLRTEGEGAVVFVLRTPQKVTTGKAATALGKQPDDPPRT